MVPFNLQSPGCGRKVGGFSFLEKDSKVHGCPGKTDQFHIADHLTLSPLSPPAAVSQPRGQRHGCPQGLQLLCVIPQAPNSEQGAECSVGLHGIQSETALGLSGPRWPRHLMEKPFPIWQPTEVSPIYTLLVRIPILRSLELSDKADWLTAEKKQGN